MKKINQSGFGAIVVIFILVVIVVLFGGGYYIWQKNHKNNTAPKVALSRQNNGNSSSTSGGIIANETATITLPKWNVTFKYGSINNTSLIATWSSQNQGYNFSSTQLGQSTNNICRTEPVLFMNRGQANDIAFQSGDGSTTTFAQASQSHSGNYAKLINGYYYAIQQPQGSCTTNENSTDGQAFNNANAAATSILSLN